MILNEMTAIYVYELRRLKNEDKTHKMSKYLIALLAQLNTGFFYYCTQFTQFFCTWLYIWWSILEVYYLIENTNAYSCEFWPNYFPFDIYSMRKKMQEKNLLKYFSFYFDVLSNILFFFHKYFAYGLTMCSHSLQFAPTISCLFKHLFAVPAQLSKKPIYIL